MDDGETAHRVRTWARTLQSLAQAGLTYARDAYDLERYRALRALAAEMLAAAVGELPERVAGVLEAERGYLTPKVDVRAAVFREGLVLLVREQTDGLWSLPGGWADVGASPSENAVREVREETGYLVRAAKIAAVYDKTKHAQPDAFWDVYKLFVLCELVGGEAATSHETTAVGFFGRHELPPLSLGRVTEAQVARMFEHHDHPDLPTDFD
jgi:ADP-ribose pyrophosphatase YjhB (NUDIX family)